MRGPCLCGDPACPSCGTAQGTYTRHYRRRRKRVAPPPASSPAPDTKPAQPDNTRGRP